MNLIILSENNSLHSVKRLLEEAVNLNITAESINIYKKSYLNEDIKTPDQIILGRHSGVRFDDYDLLFMKKKLLSGALVENNPDRALIFRQKCSQHLFFQEHNIPHIDTLILRGLFTRSELLKTIDKEFTDLSWDRQSYLAKMSRGNQGKGITLLKGIDSLNSYNETFHALKDQRYIIQPYLNIQKEYRILVINNQIQGALEKEKQDDFRANSNRCESRFISKESMPEDLINLTKKCIKSSKLFYCGIDVALINGRYKVLEINCCPGFEDFERKSKQNIALTILNEIIKLV